MSPPDTEGAKETPRRPLSARTTSFTAGSNDEGKGGDDDEEDEDRLRPKVPSLLASAQVELAACGTTTAPLKTPTHACVRVLLFLLLLWWTSPLHFVFLFRNPSIMFVLSVCLICPPPPLHLVIDAAPHVLLSSKIPLLVDWPPDPSQKNGFT